jgi:hypothetical protein
MQELSKQEMVSVGGGISLGDIIWIVTACQSFFDGMSAGFNAATNQNQCSGTLNFSYIN